MEDPSHRTLGSDGARQLSLAPEGPHSSESVQPVALINLDLILPKGKGIRKHTAHREPPRLRAKCSLGTFPSLLIGCHLAISLVTLPHTHTDLEPEAKDGHWSLRLEVWTL